MVKCSRMKKWNEIFNRWVKNTRYKIGGESRENNREILKREGYYFC